MAPLCGAVPFHHTEPVSIVTPPCIGSPVSRVAATFVPVAVAVEPDNSAAAENASFVGAAAASWVTANATGITANAASAVTLPLTPTIPLPSERRVLPGRLCPLLVSRKPPSPRFHQIATSAARDEVGRRVLRAYFFFVARSAR